MGSSRRSRDAVNKIFGEAFPEVTVDEGDVRSPEDDAERERWLRDNVPPHHE
jgi:hypothetical protein